MGLFDIPSMVKFIQEETSSHSGEIKKIIYIGHSQGTSQFFAGMSLLPEFYEKNFNGMIALGPVTNLKNIKSSLIKTMINYHLDYITDLSGFTEVFPNKYGVTVLEKLLCTYIPFICNKILEAFADSNTEDDDKDRFKVFISHFPSGASYKSIKHFEQNIKNNSFASYGDNLPYDFSKPKNIKISLFVGGKDELATVKDNRIFKEILKKNGLLNFYKEYPLSGHLSFFISKGNDFMIDLIEKVKEYSE
jgi:lysosomal acid lipase/cholesteryl ester hydrolase